MVKELPIPAVVSPTGAGVRKVDRQASVSCQRPSIIWKRQAAVITRRRAQIHLARAFRVRASKRPCGKA